MLALHSTVISLQKPYVLIYNTVFSFYPRDNNSNYNIRFFFILLVFVLFLTWLLAIMQPHGLRFRSYVMEYYHPDVARTRAIWLHNRVIRRRINFVTFARRFLRRKFGLGGDSAATPSCLDFIYSKWVFDTRIKRLFNQFKTF